MGHSVAAILDTETTGLKKSDELIELAVILFRFDEDTGALVEVLNEYQGLRYPKVRISREATKIHGLTKSMLKGSSLDYYLVNSMFDQTDILIAHNASFDRRFVIKEFPGADDKRWYCSVNGISWASKGYESRALQSLLDTHDIQPGTAHRALDDTRALLELLTAQDEKGGTYLHELLTEKQTGAPQSKPGQAEQANKVKPTTFKDVALVFAILFAFVCVTCMFWVILLQIT